MEAYYTFEFAIDRGPHVWARFGTERQQLGPYGSEEEAWRGFDRTHPSDPPAWIVRVDEVDAAPETL